MSDKVPTITEDERPITTAFVNCAGEGYVLGRGGVTRIAAYNECGEYAYIPWVAIYRGEEIAMRFPAHQLTLGYEDPNVIPF